MTVPDVEHYRQRNTKGPAQVTKGRHSYFMGDIEPILNHRDQVRKPNAKDRSFLDVAKNIISVGLLRLSFKQHHGASLSRLGPVFWCTPRVCPLARYPPWP